VVPSQEAFIELTACLAKDERYHSAIGDAVVSFQWPFGVATGQNDDRSIQEAMPLLRRSLDLRTS